MKHNLNMLYKVIIKSLKGTMPHLLHPCQYPTLVVYTYKTPITHRYITNTHLKIILNRCVSLHSPITPDLILALTPLAIFVSTPVYTIVYDKHYTISLTLLARTFIVCHKPLNRRINMNRHIFWNYWNNIPRRSLYHFLDGDGYDWYQFTLIHTDQSNVAAYGDQMVVTAKFYKGEVVNQAIDADMIYPTKLFREFLTLFNAIIQQRETNND